MPFDSGTCRGSHPMTDRGRPARAAAVGLSVRTAHRRGPPTGLISRPAAARNVWPMISGRAMRPVPHRHPVGHSGHGGLPRLYRRGDSQAGSARHPGAGRRGAGRRLGFIAAQEHDHRRQRLAPRVIAIPRGPLLRRPAIENLARSVVDGASGERDPGGSIPTSPIPFGGWPRAGPFTCLFGSHRLQRHRSARKNDTPKPARTHRCSANPLPLPVALVRTGSLNRPGRRAVLRRETLLRRTEVAPDAVAPKSATDRSSADADPSSGRSPACFEAAVRRPRAPSDRSAPGQRNPRPQGSGTRPDTPVPRIGGIRPHATPPRNDPAQLARHLLIRNVGPSRTRRGSIKCARIGQISQWEPVPCLHFGHWPARQRRRMP